MTKGERTIDRLVRRYPPRWRDAHGDDLRSTVTDLLDERPDGRFPLRLRLDLGVGAWRAWARDDLAASGLLGAAVRQASVLAALVATAVGMVWIERYATTGIAPPEFTSVGGASGVVYVLALVGVPLGLGASLGGLRRAGTASAWTGAGSWLLLTGVELLVATPQPRAAGAHILLAWAVLLAVAATGIQRGHERVRAVPVLAGLVVATVLGQLLLGGSADIVAMTSLAGGLLVVGGASVHGVLTVGWLALIVVGLLTARVDPRPAAAAAVLAPVPMVLHLVADPAASAGLGIAGALAIGVALLARDQEARLRRDP